ncbi:MAG TPA: rod shape-determining protein MreC [Candidatus Moranbacteria bacterium]|nr:rod shape-determining protein MreC [Candidatus Moranbacteria bacterium]
MPKKHYLSKVVKLFLVISVSLLFIFFSAKNTFFPARRIFLRMAYPFQESFYLASKKTRDVVTFLGSIAKLKKQNEKLIKENSALLFQVANLQDQKKENENLRKQLQLAPRNKYDLESTLVIGQDSYGLGSWIIINKGENAGFKKGMPVIVSNGILVGKVGEVYANSSKVILLTDSSTAVDAIDLETSAKGFLSGEYSLGLIMKMVEQTAVLNQGDKIITSGLGGIFPRGLLIGRLWQTSNTSDKLFQQAIVMPEVKYSNLEMVFVIKK